MARATALRREEPLTLEEILTEELLGYKEDAYSPRFSPIFWRTVFVRWYQDEPKGDSDKRWDELFKAGVPTLRKLLKVSGSV